MKKVYKLLSILTIGFIFYQSSLSASASSEVSGVFVNLINNVLQYVHINININTLSLLIRKLAHFLEFFILGFFLIKGFNYKIIYLLIIVLLVAITDESIQIFVNGRAFQITDIIIDFIGGLTSILLFKRTRL